MKCFFIFLFLTTFNCFGQEVSEINTSFKNTEYITI